MVGSVCSSTFSQTLKPGDSAPQLHISAWLRRRLPNGTPYVVDFWSPKVPACVRTIPKLCELAHKYKGRVSFLGVAVGDASALEVKRYLGKIGLAMTYPVALDRRPDTPVSSKALWLDAAGMGAPRFIPTSFVVGKDGRIRWIGSAFDLPQVLGKVLVPAWDIESFARMFRVQQDRMNKQYALMHDPVLNELSAARKAMVAKQYQAVIHHIEAMMKSRSPRRDTAVALGVPLMLHAYRMLGDMTGYYVQLRRASVTWAGNPHVLNALAWEIVDPASQLSVRDNALALRCAERAVKLTERENAHMLDTLAWAYWRNGRKGLAMSTESAALRLAKDPDRAEMSQALKKFMGT